MIAKLTTALFALAVLAACESVEKAEDDVPPPPSTTLPGRPGTCAVIESRSWQAWVNAMPGPNAKASLIVVGEIVLPTPGYTATLTAGMADKSMRPVQQLILDLTPPAGPVAQVLTPVSVRYEGPAISMQYRGVRIMCGGAMLTEVDDVPVAR